MDLDRKISGRVYIGRIKSFDEYKGEDELYGIVYKGRGSIDYNLCKSICTTHNGKFFWAQKINQVMTFTMRECLAAVRNFPQFGRDGVSMVDHPMTFEEFVRLAYENAVLSSKEGFEILGDESRGFVLDKTQKVPLPPKTSSKLTAQQLQKKQYSDVLKSVSKEAMNLRLGGVDTSGFTAGERQLMGERGNASGDFVSPDELLTNSEEVLGPSGDGYANFSMDNLRDRCLMAETKNESLEAVVSERDAEIATLKARLESASQDSNKFMSSADLANTRLREFRADNASEVALGLKKEFDLVKGMSTKLAKLSTFTNTRGEEQKQLLTEVVQSLEDLPARLTATFASFENAVNANTKTLAENVRVVWSVLEDFGLSKNHTPVDIPRTLRSLVKGDLVDGGSQTCSDLSASTDADTVSVGVSGKESCLEKSSVISFGGSVFGGPKAVQMKVFDDYYDEDDGEGEDGVVELHSEAAALLDLGHGGHHGDSVRISGHDHDHLEESGREGSGNLEQIVRNNNSRKRSIDESKVTRWDLVPEQKFRK